MISKFSIDVVESEGKRFQRLHDLAIGIPESWFRSDSPQLYVIPPESKYELEAVWQADVHNGIIYICLHGEHMVWYPTHAEDLFIEEQS